MTAVWLIVAGALVMLAMIDSPPPGWDGRLVDAVGIAGFLAFAAGCVLVMVGGW